MPLQTARWKAKRNRQSIREIARKLGMHRDTAEKYPDSPAEHVRGGRDLGRASGPRHQPVHGAGIVRATAAGPREICQMRPTPLAAPEAQSLGTTGAMSIQSSPVTGNTVCL